jgi:beta-galactosidase
VSGGGTRVLGVCYYPEHWPEGWWEDDARRMRELGIAYVRIGEFAWSRIEPARGRFDWGWLDRALAVLGRAGLKVVLGTPTCAPPRWLIDERPEILPVDRDGRSRGFGSRRHYSLLSDVYAPECDRIVEALARRYGRHDALVGWQTDNEYGNHDTTLSFGPLDLAAFRDWLRRRYRDAAALDEAWGNAFWGMHYGSFAAVELPNLAVAGTNPAAWLDFQRFASERVVAFNRRQVEIIRAHSPERFVTHNFMGVAHDYDHFALAEDLDFPSLDSYPLALVERFPLSEAERSRWALTSHPDLAAFHHDLCRGIGGGRFWVMEQQPGPANWTPWNPAPLPGMVRLWSWEALAHGAEVVCYFRWRQCPFAQEQMHSGLHLPDRELAPGGEDVARLGRELDGFALPPTTRAPVALLFDYEACWITRIQPHGADFSYSELTFRWYQAARLLGLDVDVVTAGASLAGYAAVLVPTLPHVGDGALAAFRDYDGPVLFGPRSGSKTHSFRIPDVLPPGPLQELLPLKVIQVASLRPGLTEAVTGEGLRGRAERWREWLRTGLPALARFADGSPALVHAGRRYYLACWPDAELLAGVLELLLVGEATLAVTRLPPHVRLRRRGDLTFAFNYGPDAWEGPATGRIVGAGPAVPAQDVGCWRA